MWELYDTLIEALPEDRKIDEVVSGTGWTMVRTANEVGLAMTIHETSRPAIHSGPWIGMPIKQAAQFVKSWNFEESAVGLAAINTFFNSRDHALKQGISLVENDSALNKDAFLTHTDMIRGKRVCVIGHFPFLEERFAPHCTLSILERSPQNGDFPDSACEYILPEQDFVFITGCTLVNKTLPRLLELSKNAYVVLVGPSVPLSPVLFQYGADELSGTVITQPELCAQLAAQGGSSIFQSGQMVRFVK